MAKKSVTANRVFYALTLLVFVGGLIFWLSDLTSDPPMYYTGLGQSLSTDPAQYVYHARNKILFEDPDPFDYGRWTVYRHSLTSLVAYLWFSVAGVSLKQVNMVGLLLCLGGLIFFVLGIARHHRPWVTTAVTLCYLINVTLLTYGRLSYLENGLILITSVLFFVYSRWGDRLWGAALCGALVALAALTGKLFGALLMPALVLAILFSGGRHRWKYTLVSIGLFVVTSAALVLSLYGGDLAAAFGYVSEQSYGLRGFPQGLSSPWGFFEHLISYGFKNRLYYKDPDLFMFLCVAGLLLALCVRSRNDIRRLSPVTIFSVFWVAAAILGLMPLNYSPVRYTLLFIPGIIVLAFCLIDHVLSLSPGKISGPGKVGLALSAVLFWFALYHVFGNLLFFNTSPFPTSALTWSTLPGAIALTLLLRFVIMKGYIRLTRRVLTGGLVTVVCVSCIVNAFRIRRDHFLDHNFNILESNQEIEELLGDGAVLSGPYAPALTINNEVKSFIHLFGVAAVDSTLFDRYPITHIAVDATNRDEAVRQYPQLQGSTPIANLWIRDYPVQVYNVSKAFRNPQANAYRESAYEKAVGYVDSERIDSAIALLDGFYRQNPFQKSAGLLLAHLLQKSGRTQKAYSILTSLAERYPTDFYVQIQCAKYLQALAMLKKDRYLLNLARQYYDRSARANPFKVDMANRTYAQVMRQFQPETPSASD